MADRILYLFPDTNLFIQCQPLPELDWDTWGFFDEIRLIVSRPVQNEIDKHKNRGNDRVAKRARTAASLLRGIIAADGAEKVVRDAEPVVKVMVRIDLRPDPNLEDRLDYGEPDDRLVGIARAFAQQNSSADVRVLTHDGGPLASAKMVDVAAEVIPDDWLLPPETSDAEKKVAALEGEIARLKKTEPQIVVGCYDADGGQIKKLEIEMQRYLPVSEEQVSDLMKRIRDRFPIVTDFGSPDEQGEHLVGIGFRTREFVPATAKQISDYQAEYARWLENCEEILRSCHMVLERRSNAPRIRFWAENIGTRPAKDTLVTIEAKGELALMVPERKKPEADEPLALPRPPRAPRGRWVDQDPFKMLHGAFGTAHALGSLFDARPLALDLLKPPRPRDPNAFYYKPWPEVPVPEVNLECMQWRHGVGPKEFEFEIHFDRTQAGTVEGALEFRIHAENLSGIEKLLVPVRITICEVRACETAKDLVQQLTRPSVLSAHAGKH